MSDSKFFKSGGGGGAGSGIALKSAFDTSTAMADPGNGEFRLNNATPASVTAIAISHTTSSGADAGALITGLSEGDLLYIQQIGSESKYVLLEVTSITDNTTWSQIAVSVSDSGSIFDAASECGLDFSYLSDDVKTFQDFQEIAEPADPASNELRVFAEDDNGFGVLNVKDSTGLKIRLGRDQYVLVANNTGSSLTVGQVVYYNGNSTGDIPDVGLAQADDPATMPAIGVVEETIANGSIGRVAIGGVIDNVNTAAFSAGDEIFVSSTVAGGLTTTPPSHPNLQQRIAIIKVSDASTGSALIGIGLNPDGDSFGTRQNTYSIGDDTAGTKTFEFKNGNTGSLSWNPSAARTVNIPDLNTTLGEEDVKQFIKGDNNSFETSIGDWAAYADAAGAEPVDGTGGSPTTTITRTTSTPLVGDGSMLLTKDAANRQGEGGSLSSIAIPLGYQGLPIKVSFVAEASANYATSDVVIFAYDQTNSELLGSAFNANDGGVEAGTKTYEGIIYPRSNTASIRLIAHIATTNASSYTVKFDNVQLFWEPEVSLPAIGSWKDYTPSTQGLGTVSFSTAKYAIVGSSVHLIIKGNIGTRTADEMQVGLPSNFQVASGHSLDMVGNLEVAETNERQYPALATTGDGFLNFGRRGASLADSFTAKLGTQIFGANNIDFGIYATVPIESLSANTTDALAINGGLTKQIELLGSDVTTNTNFMSFDIVPGRDYLVLPTFAINGSSITVTYKDSATDIVTHTYRQGTGQQTEGVPVYFTAESDTLNLESGAIGAGESIDGDGTKSQTFVQVIEYPFSQTALIGLNKTAIISYKLSNNTVGGSATGTTYTARPINTIESDPYNIINGSISSNQFILPAGTYSVDAIGSFFRTRESKIRLYNVTSSSSEVVGLSVFAPNDTTFNGAATAPLKGQFTLSEESTLEFQYYVTDTAGGTSALGDPVNAGDDEVYFQAEITRKGGS